MLNRKKKFNVFKGENYGKSHIKLLVFGASIYCNLDCPLSDICMKDISTIDNGELCPEYKEHKDLNERFIKNAPGTELLEGGKTYSKFFQLINRIAEFKGFDRNSIAFTEYCQHMIIGRYTTDQKDISDDDFECAMETIQDVEPNFVILWGSPVRNNFLKNIDKCFEEKRFSNLGEGEDSDLYYKVQYGDTIDTIFTAVCISHPSYNRNSAKENDLEQIEKALIVSGLRNS